MNTTLQAEKILDNAQAENLYQDLVLQINKDFSRAAIDENFNDSTTPKSVVRRLVALLFELITTNFESYLNLLYAIDVPERSVKELPEQEVDKRFACLFLKENGKKYCLKTGIKGAKSLKNAEFSGRF